MRQGVEHTIEAADGFGDIARIADRCCAGAAVGAGPGGIDLGCERNDFDVGPEGAKAIDGGRRNGDDDDAAGVERRKRTGRQTVVGIGMLPADREAAVPFDVAKYAAWNADVFAVEGGWSRLQTRRELKAWVVGVATARRGNENVLTARFGTGEKHEEARA